VLGNTVNQFIVQAALREAERLIEQEQVIRLNRQASKAFFNALSTPSLPNPKLRAALEDYDQRQHDQIGKFNWLPRS